MSFSTTICTVIEAGPLEQQVLLLADSLRAFGGRWARVPMLAVKPRRGPAIPRATRDALRRLDVAFVDAPLNVACAWWAHANKPAAMAYAERHATTPNVTWMDGDMMVLREPDEFAPPPGARFIARAGEGIDVASDGRDDGAVFWRRLCAEFGLDFDRFPTITSFPDDRPIKAYWQTGLFTYPRDAGFGAKHAEIIGRMLNGTIASRKAGTFHTDQVSAALAVQALGLVHAHYDPRMNFNYNVLDQAAARRLPIEEVRILHYHGSFWPAAFGWASEGLAVLPGDRRALIARHAPFRSGGRVARLKRKLFGLTRKAKLAAYEARVERF